MQGYFKKINKDGDIARHDRISEFSDFEMVERCIFSLQIRNSFSA